MCEHQDVTPEGRIRLSRRQLVAGLASGTVVALAPGCVENAALGRSQLITVSPQQLAQLSAQTWQATLQSEPISRDPNLNNRVRRVGNRITAASGLRENWEYVVIDSDTQNAWVLPGGRVAFYRGILETMQNDDEVATVMGHEVAHVAGRHAAERASQQMVGGLGLAAAGVALQQAEVDNAQQIAAALGAGVTFGVILPYSRTHELEADRLGTDYMSRAGYRPSAALDFWRRRASSRSGARQPEFFSTHPADATRIEALQQHIQRMGYA